jgi:chorismate mutase/prephenate dehydratase
MSLSDWRKEIDQLDEVLVKLLNRRALTAMKIGREKRKCSAGVQDPEREKQVLARIRDLNPGPMSNEALLAIYRQVISGCVQVQSVEVDDDPSGD